MRRTATVILAVVVALAGCGRGNKSPSPVSEETTTATTTTISESSGDVTDERPELLAMLGPPDTFAIAFSDVDGTWTRYETWTYHELGTSIDLVDGGIAWDVEIAMPADGALYPLWYDPADFTALMPRDEALAVVTKATNETSEFESIRLDDPDAPEYDGAEFVVGDQIVLGFALDRLVYVETYYLEPEGGS